MNDEFTCIVSADLFRRALFGISKEETRYYLNGVYVTSCKDGGAVLVATDGHIMIILRDPRGVVSGSGIVDLSTSLKRELKEPRGGLLIAERAVMASDKVAYVVESARVHKNKDGVEVEPREDLPALFDTPDKRVIAAQYQRPTIDGKFPDYTRAVPTNAEAVNAMGAFNATLLNRVGQALNSGRSLTLQLTVGADPKGPSLANGDGTVDGFGVIMPLRFDHKRGLPGWWAKA